MTYKKMIASVLIIIMCVFIVSCNHNSSMTTKNSSADFKDGQNMNNNCILIVDGKDISSESFVSINCEKQYAELPLIAISETLGGQVEWITEKKVIIIINDTKYVLNPREKTLKKEGNSFNIIAVPPGTRHGGHYQVCDQEFIIDSDSLRHFIYLLGAEIKIDYDNFIVNIKKKG